MILAVSVEEPAAQKSQVVRRQNTAKRAADWLSRFAQEGMALFTTGPERLHSKIG
jgi:hypothetical protein